MYANALITGASSGLGRGLASFFAARGVKVYGAARRVEATAELAKEQGNIIPVKMDVSNTKETIDCIRRIDDECGGLELVVANAGVGNETFAPELDWQVAEEMIAVNVSGAAATLAAVLPRMVQRGCGHLVGVSSLAASRGMPRSGVYSASKAFLSTFLEGLRVDLQGTGVTVTTLEPGFVKTPLTEKNAFQMPFLLELDDAVNRMGEAILRGEAQFAFPWPLATAVRLAKLLPNAVWDAAGKVLAPERLR